MVVWSLDRHFKWKTTKTVTKFFRHLRDTLRWARNCMNEKAGKGLGPQVTCPRKSWDEITAEREDVHWGKWEYNGSNLVLGDMSPDGNSLVPGISLLRVSKICFTKGALPEISYQSSLKAVNGEEQKDSKWPAWKQGDRKMKEGTVTPG